MILLALIPVVHYIAARMIASRDGIVSKLRSNYAIMYLDWTFVGVNISYALSASHSGILLGLCAALCIGPIIFLKRGWRDARSKRKETTLFFSAGRLNRLGWVHGAFMLVQGSLSLAFFLSPAQNAWYLLGCAALLAYFSMYCWVIKFVRRLRFTQKVEMPLVLTGLVLTAVRAILALSGVW